MENEAKSITFVVQSKTKYGWNDMEDYPERDDEDDAWADYYGLKALTNVNAEYRVVARITEEITLEKQQEN